MTWPQYALGETEQDEGDTWVVHLRQPMFLAKVVMKPESIQLAFIGISQTLDRFDSLDCDHLLAAGNYFYDEIDEPPMRRQVEVLDYKGTIPEFIRLGHASWGGVISIREPAFIWDMMDNTSVCLDPEAEPELETVEKATDWLLDTFGI